MSSKETCCCLICANRRTPSMLNEYLVCVDCRYTWLQFNTHGYDSAKSLSAVGGIPTRKLYWCDSCCKLDQWKHKGRHMPVQCAQGLSFGLIHSVPKCQHPHNCAECTWSCICTPGVLQELGQSSKCFWCNKTKKAVKRLDKSCFANCPSCKLSYHCVGDDTKREFQVCGECYARNNEPWDPSEKLWNRTSCHRSMCADCGCMFCKNSFKCPLAYPVDNYPDNNRYRCKRCDDFINGYLVPTIQGNTAKHIDEIVVSYLRMRI